VQNNVLLSFLKPVGGLGPLPPIRGGLIGVAGGQAEVKVDTMYGEIDMIMEEMKEDIVKIDHGVEQDVKRIEVHQVTEEVTKEVTEEVTEDNIYVNRMSLKKPDALLFFPNTSGYSTAMLIALHTYYSAHIGQSEWISLPASNGKAGFLVLRGGVPTLLHHGTDEFSDPRFTEQLRRRLATWFRGMHDQSVVAGVYPSRFYRYDHTVIVVHTSKPRIIHFQALPSSIVLYPGDILIPSRYARLFFSTIPIASPHVTPLLSSL